MEQCFASKELAEKLEFVLQFAYRGSLVLIFRLIKQKMI
jgi:hypothetical protein